MSTETTRTMIAAYFEEANPTMFLSGFFQSPSRNFHTTEEVEFDVVRGGEDVAIVLTDLSSGYRLNETDIYTNKSFKPPIFKEKVGINSFDLLKREAGETPFESPDFRRNVISRIFRGLRASDAKIRRSIELQASQIMQTGVVTLINADGDALYTLDFKPKATHNVTVGTAWDDGAATIAADIAAIAEVIRTNGLHDPDQLIFGIDAFEVFMQDDDIIRRFDTRRANQGAINPMVVGGEGGTFHGKIEIGHYSYEIWTYGKRFTHPQTGVATPYIDPENCLVRASSGRMDATFGAIPNIGREIGAPGTALLPELPGRMSSGERNIDLHINAWLSEDGEQLFAGVGARPLLIPTAIDTFGKLDTGL